MRVGWEIKIFCKIISLLLSLALVSCRVPGKVAAPADSGADSSHADETPEPTPEADSDEAPDDSEDEGDDEPMEETEAPGTSGTYVVAGTLNVGRKAPLAAVLKSGKVLVVGGLNSANAKLRSAEIFSPHDGTFTLTGSLQTINDGGGTIVALDDGTALVTGSYFDGSTTVSWAERYDPDSGTFSAASAPVGIRDGGSRVTLLDDGRALYNGGTGTACSFGASGPIATTEIYDPEGDSWSYGPYTGTRTRSFAVKLPDGRVFIGGGQHCFISGIFGPMLTDDYSSGIFDPSNDSYTAKGAMPYAAYNGAAFSNGWVVGTGGAYGVYFDPGAGVWSSFAAAHAWGAHEPYVMVTLDNDDIFTLGNDWDRDEAQLFHLAAGVFTFSWTPSLTYGGLHPTVVKLKSGNILILGSDDNIAKAQKYFP